MKKFGLISLLIIFCFNMAGFYAVFGIQLYRVKDEMFQQLSSGRKQELLLLKIPSEEDEPLMIFGSKEFYYRGAMYDLVQKQRHEDGSLLLSCYLDLGETSLLKAFSNLMKTGRENHKKRNAGFKLFFKIYPKISREDETVSIAFLTSSGNNFFGSATDYTPPRLPKEGKPPRQV